MNLETLKVVDLILLMLCWVVFFTFLYVRRTRMLKRQAARRARYKRIADLRMGVHND